MTAVVQAQTVVWDKRISGNPEQGFSVELPVSGYHHCDYEERERRVETGLD